MSLRAEAVHAGRGDVSGAAGVSLGIAALAQDWGEGTQGFINGQCVGKDVHDRGIDDDDVRPLGVAGGGRASHRSTKVVFFSHRIAIRINSRWFSWISCFLHIFFFPFLWLALPKSSGSAVVVRQTPPQEVSAGSSFQVKDSAVPQPNRLGLALRTKRISKRCGCLVEPNAVFAQVRRGFPRIPFKDITHLIVPQDLFTSHTRKHDSAALHGVSNKLLRHGPFQR